MLEAKKRNNFIGEYFRQYIKQTGFDRKLLCKRLDWDYTNNLRMICFYLNKKDYLWEQFEIEKWCSALMIKKSTKIYKILMEKAGKKKYDYSEEQDKQ